MTKNNNSTPVNLVYLVFGLLGLGLPLGCLLSFALLRLISWQAAFFELERFALAALVGFILGVLAHRILKRNLHFQSCLIYVVLSLLISVPFILVDRRMRSYHPAPANIYTDLAQMPSILVFLAAGYVGMASAGLGRNPKS